MRSNLVDTFAAEGALPAMADMMNSGVSADNGLLAPFPDTTGSILPTLLTGTWPAEHGIVSDNFFRTGSPDFA
jgi:predicted AlkP superfamily pyrophosphatase or phosphodiesterase